MKIYLSEHMRIMFAKYYQNLSSVSDGQKRYLMKEQCEHFILLPSIRIFYTVQTF